jgi:hypothetical protein
MTAKKIMCLYQEKKTLLQKGILPPKKTSKKMGQGACKGNLEGDICKLGECVSKLEGRAANSASPSDIWRVSIKDGVLYKGMPVHCAWLKVFVSNPTRSMRPTDGLLYELKVYRDVVDKLIEQMVCPNFVRYLSSTTSCSFKDVKEILATQKIGELNLMRSLCYMTKRPRPSDKEKVPDTSPRKRPAINEHVTIQEATAIKSMHLDTSRLKFGMLLTQDRVVKTLSEWFTSRTSDSDFACMMLQVTAALRAMELSKFVHNDLHLKNILVELNSTATNVMYKVDGEEFGICVRFRILIFDFDRAYVQQLGRNTLLYRHKSYAHKFVDGRDLGSVLSQVFRRCSKWQGNLLEKAFHVKAGEYMKKMQDGSVPTFNSVERGQHRLASGERATNQNAYVRFDTAPSVRGRASMVSAMQTLYKAIGRKCSIDDAAYIYVCKRSMFHSDGRLRS